MVAFALSLLVSGLQAAQNYTPYSFTAFAGSPGTGTADGIGSAAQFAHPQSVATDQNGNVFVADYNNNTVRKITPAGVVTTVAGTPGVSGSLDAIGTAAQFNHPYGIAVDSNGNIYVSDIGNYTIRKITAAGVVTTLAGTPGISGGADGTGLAAQFSTPSGVVVDGSGNVYVADIYVNTIRKITPAGVVTTFAGAVYSTGTSDGQGSAARFISPTGLAIDGSGNIYVADPSSNRIRKITSGGVVTTLAGSAGTTGSADGTGTAARFWSPNGMAVDPSGNLYVADSYNGTVRKIVVASALVTTFAGQMSSGSANGTGAGAQFYWPRGVAIDGNGNLYVADTLNATIRKITAAGVVTTLAGTPGTSGNADGTGASAKFNTPSGVAVDGNGNVFVADMYANCIRKITPGGVVTTLAGGSYGSVDGTGSAATFASPMGVAIDTAGNVYVADKNNHTIRKITPSGAVSTLAGSAGNSGNTDGIGSAARFAGPSGIAIDGSGSLYVADLYNHAIRKVTASGIVSTLAGNSASGGDADGTGTAAQFSSPFAVAVDAGGNVYVADEKNHNIRRITSAGVMTTLGGQSGFGGPGSSNGAGPAARFFGPNGIAVDSNGDLFVADSLNNEIRKGSVRLTGNSVYYVSPSGSDSNAGTSLAKPYQTIGRAVSTMVAGDTCYIRAGIYRETLKPSFSGTSSAPITITAYNNESVTITGADPITGWTPSSGSIYQAPLNWDLGMGFNQIFVDGVMMYQARFPHMGASNSLLNPAFSKVTIATDNSVTSTDFTQPNGSLVGGYMVGRAGQAWAWQWATITNSSANGTLTVASGPSKLWWFNGAGQVYVFGLLSLLGVPGEWHNQNNTLYLWSPASDNPSAHLVEAKRRAWTVDYNGQSYVNVSGLRLIAGAVNMSGSNCILANCTASYLSHFTLFYWDASDGGGGGGTGNQGVFVTGSDNWVTGCTITNTAGSGIDIEGTRGYALRNTIHDIDYSGTYSAPIRFGYKSSLGGAWFNTAFNGGRDIIQPYGQDIDLRYNDCSFPGLLAFDVGCIYTGNMDAKGSYPNGMRIAYNWAHDNHAPIGAAPSHGIYIDNYNRNFLIDHNVAWNLDFGGEGVNLNPPTAANRVYNNTYFACSALNATFYDPWPTFNPDPAFWTSDLVQYTVANDLFLGSNPSTQLVDYANGNFQLVAGAPAINAGQVIPGMTDGYLGSAPDLGAYEYGGVRWTAGVNGIAADLPVVTNASGAASIQGASAVLNGQLSVSDFQATSVTVYWGPSDGGTNGSAWANSAKLNLTADGSFSSTVNGLASNAVYYYRCFVSNATGSTWAPASASFQTLSIPGSPTIVTQPQAATLPPAGSVTLSVSATGNGPFTYQWLLNGATIPGATSASYFTSVPGSYTVVVSNAVGATTSSSAAITGGIRLINLSILTSIDNPGETFTMGYVVGGSGTSGTKPLVIRAAGPSLGVFGVPGTLNDPKIELFAGSTKTYENDNWGGSTSIATAMAGVGAFAYMSASSKDAAAVASVAAGDNSVKVSASDNGTGAVIAEIYDATPTASFTTSTPRLINVSVLKNIGSGQTVGFVIGGIGTKTVLIRAVGPTLGAAPFNVPGVAADPQITLFSGQTAIASNDNWGTPVSSDSASAAQLASAFTQVGAFALTAGSKDAALLATLAPGNYTVQVSGVGNTSGIALVEVYDVP